MCHIWKYPSNPEEEISPGVINKLPKGFKRINIGGGEPMLRKDIEDIVEILRKKTNHLEFSTNGYYTDRLINIIQKYPDIRVRVSIDGFPQTNDRIRGIKNGFDHALRTVFRLKEIGAKDIGFGITISHRNATEIIDLYMLAVALNVEFSQCIVHDAWQFRIPNNIIKDGERVIAEIKKFIKTLLSSKRNNLYLRFKDWFRAYLNLGFINFLQGKNRILPCNAGTDQIFLDPFGEIYACNALEYSMGNLRHQNFDEIWNGDKAQKVRKIVANCPKNCWMTGTSRPAMRENPWAPIFWVLSNKFRLIIGKSIRWI
jgi:MoaA/NifB/PqqE/SkfB family radical SAM enzyme